MMKLIPFNRRNLIRTSDAFDGFYDVLDDFFSGNGLTHRNLTHDTFKLDIEETDNQYIVEADLPGVEKDEINLNIDDGRLMISVNREEVKDVEEKNYIHKERRYTSMSRGIYLDGVDYNEITAKLDNGVLNIHIPKKVKADEKRTIEIE